MHPVTLLLGIHNHQPVGNFGHVFRKAYERCYRPFLDLLERHPHVRLTLHYTGPLLEWFENEEPAFLDRLAKLVMANQVEILGGGFYEPILSVIPDRDAVGQVTLLSRWLRRRLGATPRGLWLAERAWEGSLPKKLAPTGLRYAILDDSHFAHAGLDPGTLLGYYLTEKEGHPLAIFPISKDLRYLIPFRIPEEVIGFLARLGERGGEVAVTYADDGEKFGLWPDTYKWVYDEGYLERLFAALERESSWLRLQTFGEYLDAHPPTGRVYLPAASYEELMEWALPVPAAKALVERRAELDRAGRLAAFRPYLRGGFWDGFLLKYSEANHMHKRMLDVSARVAQAFPSGTDVPEPVRLVWRAQGNDAYWHGLFGGLYLNYLRHETYRNLIEAETRAEAAAHTGYEWLTMRVTDLDLDGHEEIVMSSRSLGVILAPACGGSLLELDYRPKCFNLSDVLTRREEAYHCKLTEAALRQGSSGDAPTSIHDQLRVKEQGLDRILRYDRHRRVSFLDRFLSPAISWEAFDRIDDEERGDCASGAYHVESERPAPQKGALTVPMVYQGTVSLAGRAHTLAIRKVYRVTKRDPAVEVGYAIASQAETPCAVRFGMELNLTLLAGNDPQRYYERPDGDRVRLHERGQCPATDRFSMVDEWSRLRVTLCLEPPGEIWYMPVETVSQSEDGVERTYQGSALLASWLLTLQPGASERVKVRLEISEI
ncbi:MAG TPA: alpha-amylase/4-alpha-glucanotransferase domain-containing protein [Nitrospirales bacterium]|nr:alpha-amylase/4-alpha-glucanotransferase domain-containing protein [Nitrospirales bacterium]